MKNENEDSNDSTSQQGPSAAELDRLVAATKKKRLGKNPGQFMIRIKLCHVE